MELVGRSWFFAPCRGYHPALTGDGTVLANGPPVFFSMSTGAGTKTMVIQKDRMIKRLDRQI